MPAAPYKLIRNSDRILRVADGALVPPDPANADYAHFQAWAAEGNTPDPADPAPVVVPASVPRWRARAALRTAGLLEDVEAAVAAADIATQEWWAAGLEMERADPRVATLAAALGLTGAQVDDLFILAATF